MTPSTEIFIGPPGTGKTTSLLNVLDEELGRGVAPDRIGFVTFTRRGAEEAISRASKRFKIDRKELRYFRTLHSLCFRWLGLQSGSVFEGQQLRAFGAHVNMRITGRWSEDGTLSGFEVGDRILFMENLARVRCVPLKVQYENEHDQLPWDQVDRVSRALHQFKESEGLLDYTDMLSEFCRHEPRLNLEVLLVDEAQDLSALQWKVVEQLAVGARRVVVAGDDDQAIYRWAGADVERLVDMPGKPVVLGQSYRVPVVLQKLADTLISRVRRRREKEWAPRAGAGELLRVNHFDKADVDGEDVLVLARNEYVLREQVEPILRERGIVYERRGHSSIKESVMEAIVAWEALRAGQEVTAAEARTAYGFMSAGKGVARGFKTIPGLDDEARVNMAQLKESHGLITDEIWHDALDRVPAPDRTYILAARRRGEKLRRRPRIRISTIHASKGGEADHVVLLTEMAWRTYREMEFGGQDDEARVWYVAATRAKQQLTVVGSTSRNYYRV